ncbi:MAG: hypothetical protein R3C05_08625 [Pirellulaceae bacterium]
MSIQPPAVLQDAFQFINPSLVVSGHFSQFVRNPDGRTRVGGSLAVDKHGARLEMEGGVLSVASTVRSDRFW